MYFRDRHSYRSVSLLPSTIFLAATYTWPICGMYFILVFFRLMMSPKTFDVSEKMNIIFSVSTFYENDHIHIIRIK